MSFACFTPLVSFAHWENPTYHADTNTHRREFLTWLSYQTLEDINIYSRVRLTISCTDTDYIPKHLDGGKIFQTAPIPYQLMHNGVKVALDGYCGKWMTDLIYALKGHHEPQEEAVFYEVLKYIPSKATMIELGANWGYYSLWFAQEIETPTNYLIEPDPTSLEIGRKNFFLNNRTGTFIQGYAGTRPVDVFNFQNARFISIDSFLTENNLDHVHILHSDIQGEEYAMLQSAIHSIQQEKIDYFFISTHSESIHLECLNFLKTHNLEIIASHTPLESYSADGLIVGKRKDVLGPNKINISKRIPS